MDLDTSNLILNSLNTSIIEFTKHSKWFLFIPAIYSRKHHLFFLYSKTLPRAVKHGCSSWRPKYLSKTRSFTNAAKGVKKVLPLLLFALILSCTSM